MKLIFFTFSFVLILLSQDLYEPSSKCNDFYLNENLEEIAFQGQVIYKEKLPNCFVIKVEQKNGNTYTLNLFKNKIGEKIYNFIKVDDVIRNNKGQTALIIISKAKNEESNVMVFNNLCSEN